ncbi:hypothetical protein NPIL_178621 [Nephila pilipes]|uniref:Uncharacterized protein n=1 Tax=Nephila pilipes TaxID=299642 RepID=A0A8X6TAR5_NEPPI|nr:hypothetical protein NPIL_178621 [Nephila pilipes]
MIYIRAKNSSVSAHIFGRLGFAPEEYDSEEHGRYYKSTCVKAKESFTYELLNYISRVTNYLLERKFWLSVKATILSIRSTTIMIERYVSLPLECSKLAVSSFKKEKGIRIPLSWIPECPRKYIVE